MARIVIAGCGDVGTALGERLALAGHEVWGLKRDPACLPRTIRPLAADLSRPETLAGLPAGIEQVVYAASAGGYSAERYRVAYVDGVRNILALLAQREEPVQRFVLVSSTSVHGQYDGEWIDENSPAEAEGFAAENLRAGEQAVLNSDYPSVVMRLAGIYGPGRTRLIDQVRHGAASCEDGLYTNRIHRDDCAGALAHVLSLADPAPIYLGVDDAPTLQCEVLNWLADELGRPAPVVTTRRRERVRPHSNKRCSNCRLRTSGWVPIHPDYRAGYRALLDGA